MGTVYEAFDRERGTAVALIVIDDIHWADSDSLELLAEVTRGPDAPGLLLVLTKRTGTDEEAAPAPAPIEGEIVAREVLRLLAAVERDGPRARQAIVRRCVSRCRVDDERAVAVVAVRERARIRRAVQGSPFPRCRHRM
jgi:hypothetical protein